MKPFTLWTEKALSSVHVAQTESGYFYGVAFFGEVWFRFTHSMFFAAGHIYLYTGNGPDLESWMERRNS